MTTAEVGHRSGGQLVADRLVAWGVTHFFNVPGESFISVLDALVDRPQVRVVTNRHESGASFAADAFAKITGRPAVCMATRGPGASNLSIGIHTAYYDSTPMVALLGLIPSRSAGSRAFQEFDPSTMFSSIAKHVFVVHSINALANTIDQALEIAISGRPGPVVVGLPIDLLSQITTDLPSQQVARTAARPAVTWVPQEVADLLTGASHPVLLAGTEALRGDTAHHLETLALRTGLPLFTTWRRYSAVDNAHPLFAGPIARGTAPDTRSAIGRADLVLSFGFAIDDITAEVSNLDRPGLTVVQMAPGVDAELSRLAARATLIQVPLATEQALAGLLQWCDSHPLEVAELHDRHYESSASLAAGIAAPERPSPRPGKVHADYLMGEFNALLPADAVVASDVGNFAQWLLRYVPFDRERVFVGPLSGAMGYGIPGALGAGLAVPGRPIWCVGGDGGVAMTLCEMATAVGLDLDVAVLVIDNGVYGTIRNRQNIEFPGRPMIGTATGGIDFAAVARGFGWHAWTVERDVDVVPALADAMTSQGCRLVHAIVEERPWMLS